MKPSGTVWDALAADLAAASNTGDCDIASEDLVEETEEGKDNTIHDLDEDGGSGEVDPQSLVGLDGSDIADNRSEKILVGKDSSSPSLVHIQGTTDMSVIHETLDGPGVGDDLRKPHLEHLVLGKHNKNSTEEGAQLFYESTDDDGGSEPQEASEGEKQLKGEENTLGKRTRSADGIFTGTSGRKSMGEGEHDFMAPSASASQAVDEFPQHGVKIQEHRPKAEWPEPQDVTMMLPAGLEKLHRLFTSLNTACGLLQKQQLESSWQNIKLALKQLSSADGEVMVLEDIQLLANLCPRMVVLHKVNGEDSSLKVELHDPSEPKSLEQLGMSTGTMATDGQGSSSPEVKPGWGQLSFYASDYDVKSPDFTLLISEENIHELISRSACRYFLYLDHFCRKLCTGSGKGMFRMGRFFWSWVIVDYTNGKLKALCSSFHAVGRHISDTEARLLVERRQKAFQVSLAQQLQGYSTSDFNADGENTPIHPARQSYQSNDGHHSMGPAILALPTQNLVLTPPPLLSQQLQPGYISISSGYHGLPFPIQVQSANAFAPFGYPQQQTNKYSSYQISSIPSTSQPSPLPTHNVTHRTQTTPPPVVDLTEPAMTPELSPFYHAQSMNKGKRRRSRNWDTWEVVLLVQAKKTEWERSEIASGRDRFETSGERWKKVARFLKENKVIDRDAVACKNKWESLLSDYKTVKDWNRKPGNSPYSSLSPSDKKAACLPAVFASNLLDLMDTFQGKSAHVSPPSVVDSLARNIPAVSGGAASGEDGSGAEESAEALPHGANASHGSIGKRKKSDGGSSSLVAAFDRMAANMVNIEKGRDERSERLLALENRKYELERNKFELQAKKLEIEREDRKGLVRVLGNLAGAFHRMADKM